MSATTAIYTLSPAASVRIAAVDGFALAGAGEDADGAFDGAAAASGSALAATGEEDLEVGGAAADAADVPPRLLT